MNREQMLLTILAEECQEVAKRATKAIRFTMEEVQAGQDSTNAERIIYEFNDLMAVMHLLFKNEPVINHEMIALKKDKINKWLEYSKSVGTLTED